MKKMETAIPRTQTAFRLSNYVESVLMDAVYRVPNRETLAAMEEAREEKNLETINLENLEGFIDSL